MKLTRYTDYALRVLIHLAAEQDRLCSISEIAKTYGISQNHLMKVANDLVHAGYVSAVRGRKGGLRLALPPADINIGKVVRRTEEGFNLVDCESCYIAPACGLTGVVKEALAAFMSVLDRKTLADITTNKSALVQLLASPPVQGSPQSDDAPQIQAAEPRNT